MLASTRGAVAGAGFTGMGLVLVAAGGGAASRSFNRTTKGPGRAASTAGGFRTILRSGSSHTNSP